MPDKLPPGLSANYQDNFIHKVPLRITVYTLDHIITGYIYRLSPIPVYRQRLQDILNEILAGTAYGHPGFLSVTETSIYTPDQTNSTSQFSCINKDKILFAREASDEQNNNRDTGNIPIPPTSVKKKPINVKLYMPFYTINGRMHCVKGQRLSDLLNTLDQFVPVTNANIVSSLSNNQFSSEFVAINKKQVLHIHEI